MLISSASTSPSRSPSPRSSSSGSSITDGTVGLFEEVKKMKEEIKDGKDDLEYNKKKIKDIYALVSLGFLALIFVVIGIAFGYFEFVYNSSKENNDSIKKIISLEYLTISQNQRILNLEEENQKLSIIVNCLKCNRYWQYEECFK